MKRTGWRGYWHTVALLLLLALAAASCGPKTAPPPVAAPPAPVDEPVVAEPPAPAPETAVAAPAAAPAFTSPFPIPEEKKTALDRYVETPDPAFAYDTPCLLYTSPSPRDS